MCHVNRGRRSGVRAHALAIKGFTRLRGLLKDDIDFRGMTPGSFWEASDADKVIGEILTKWFEASDSLEI